MEDTHEFESSEQEVQFLRTEVKNLNERIKNLEEELDDHLDQSASYEKELETTCNHSEQKASNLEDKYSKLQIESDKLTVKLRNKSSENNHIQAELREKNKHIIDLLEKVRRLEHQNENFEKQIRESKVAEQELETQLEIVLEKLAFVDTELEEKEDYKIEIQRLKEENSELKHQIQAELRQSKAIKFYSEHTSRSNESNNSERLESTSNNSVDYASNKCKAAFEIAESGQTTIKRIVITKDEFRNDLPNLGKKFSDTELDNGEKHHIEIKAIQQNKDLTPENKWKKLGLSRVKSLRKSLSRVSIDFNRSREEEKGSKMDKLLKRLREATGFNKQKIE